MKKLRKPLIFTLCLLPIALLGGYFTAKMSLAGMDGTMVEEAIRQLGSREALIAVVVAQTILYALVCGFFGYILAEKIGLMRPFRFRKAETLRVVLISLFCGALFSLDAWTFGKWIPEVGASYAAAGRFDLTVWIASVLYGGVIEEVMMRLFVMSLLAFLGWKLFCRKDSTVPVKVLICANILAALLFAAGHLPATVLSFGRLTPLIVFRCFLLNGAWGLLFGRFYRRYGIQYAMLAHILFHLVSRSIWLAVLP